MKAMKQHREQTGQTLEVIRLSRHHYHMLVDELQHSFRYVEADLHGEEKRFNGARIEVV